MGKKTPAPPPAPDYAAANEAAINTDISTLPLRNAINASAQLGRSYTDPNTGRTYDFTGLGTADINAADLLKQLELAPEATRALLNIQKEFGGQFAQEARNQLQVTDPTGFSLRDSLGGRLSGGGKTIEELIAPQGVGSATANYEAYVRNNPDLLANWTNNASKNTQMTLAEYGKDHYDRSGRTEGRELPMTEAPIGADGMPNYERIGTDGPELSSMTTGPQFDRLGSVTLGDGASQGAGRAMLERQVFDELSLAGTPDAALQRSAEQAARARGAASGNILGDSSALQEALGVQLAQRGLDAQRRNDALNFLSSGQGTGDTANRLALMQQESDANRLGFNNAASQQEYNNQGMAAQFNNDAANQAFQNAMNAIGQRNQATQNTFGAQQAQQQARAGARQQDLANIQSFLGLQPVVSQGAQLSGLQQGAAPFAPGGGYSATGTNPNAGAQGTAFASNIFGTQAGIYGAQSKQGSPLGSIVGGLAGSFFGPIGTAIGSKVGGMIGGNKGGG